MYYTYIICIEHPHGSGNLLGTEEIAVTITKSLPSWGLHSSQGERCSKRNIQVNMSYISWWQVLQRKVRHSKEIKSAKSQGVTNFIQCGQKMPH